MVGWDNTARLICTPLNGAWRAVQHRTSRGFGCLYDSLWLCRHTADDVTTPKALELQVADAKAGGAFDLSTVWAWMGGLHRHDMVLIFPNSTDPREAGSDRMLQLLQAADLALQ